MFTLPTLILILNICIFVVSVPLLTTILPYRRRPEVRWLILLTVSFALISFCGMNVYTQEPIEYKIFFYRLRYIGLSVLGQAWFFFIALTYTRYSSFFRKWWVTALALTPSFVTIILVLTPSLHHLLTTNYEIFKWQGAVLVKFTQGPWLPFHLLTANLFAFAAIFLLLYTIPRSTGVKRKQAILLLLSGTFSLLIDGYGVVTGSPLRWAMFSGGTFLITEAAIMYAIHKHGLLDLSPIAKNLIFKEIPDPVIILDDQDRALDFNEASKYIFGLKSTDINSPWKKLPTVGSLSSENSTADWQITSSDGLLRSYQVNVINLDSQKTSDGKIIFFRDISAQKTIEERLSTDLEFRSHLLSLIAHDFSSILQTQSTLSSHLQNQVQPELRHQARALTSISLASQDLMTNILRWSQYQQDKEKSNTHPFEVNTLVKEVIDNLEGAFLLKNLNVQIQSQTSPIVMEGDSVMIESVLRNLLTNAIRASLDKGQIVVSLSKNPSSAKIELQDFGIGMSPQKLEAVRNLEGSSANHLEKRPEGFGVGLTITRKIVDSHHGQLDFKSEENKGTLVTLTLPLQVPRS